MIDPWRGLIPYTETEDPQGGKSQNASLRMRNFHLTDKRDADRVPDVGARVHSPAIRMLALDWIPISFEHQVWRCIVYNNLAADHPFRVRRSHNGEVKGNARRKVGERCVACRGRGALQLRSEPNLRGCTGGEGDRGGLFTFAVPVNRVFVERWRNDSSERNRLHLSPCENE